MFTIFQHQHHLLWWLKILDFSLKCRETRVFLVSSKQRDSLQIESEHLELPFGYTAQTTYPIFPNVQNPIFISENIDNNIKKFILCFYLTGTYKIRLSNGYDTIDEGLVRVTTSFL